MESTDTDFSNSQKCIKSDVLEFGEFHGIGYELFESMKKFSNCIAQYIFQDDSEQTFGMMLKKSIRTALKLETKLSGKNTSIGICASNHSNSCVPFIAAMFLGYEVITFSASANASDTAFLLEIIAPSLMFIDEESVPMMESAMKNSGKLFEIVVFGNNNKYESFDRYLSFKSKEDDFKPIKLDDNRKTAVILFSSGTTGLAKGICLSHEGILKQAYYVGHYNGFTSKTVFYPFSTLNWVTTVNFVVATALYGTGRVISPVETALKAIQRYKVKDMYITPYLSTLLVQQYDSSPIDLNSVEYISTAGARLSETLRRNLQNLFPNSFINQCYGETEAGGWITIFPYIDDRAIMMGKKKPNSAGVPTFGLSYKIVDTETGQLLGPNHIGHIHLKGDGSFMNGFYNRDSSDEFDSEGWFKTGDLGYFDEDHCIYLDGRCKELLKFRSFHIQPQKVEAIIDAHPAIDKVVVTSIDHEIDDEHLIGLVILNENWHIKPKEIEELVEKNLEERYWLRGGVKIVKDLPFTVTGKLKRVLIKQMLKRGEFDQ